MAKTFGQNIWNKIEISSKTGQDKKILISTFAYFFDCYCQSLISGKGGWAQGYVSTQI